MSHFHRNIFKNDISDLKQQIKDFAENWISRLEELEKRQAKEVNNFKKHESKVRKSSLIKQLFLDCLLINKGYISFAEGFFRV